MAGQIAWRWWRAGTLAAGVAVAQAQPVVPGLSAVGAAGAALTPSAAPLAPGQLLLGYDTALPGLRMAPRGHNIGLAVGLLPGLELSGRLATNDLQCNAYGLGTNPCRQPLQRDLSASFKLGHRFTHPAWPGWGLAASVGATDLGGAATNYRSWYGVLGVDHGPWAATAGLAHGVSATSPLDGGFASLQWRAAEWLQLQAEAIGSRQWVGARLMLPARWQSAGVQPWLALQHSLQADDLTPRQWWAVGLSLALGHPGAGPARAPVADAAAPARPVAPGGVVAEAATPAVAVPAQPPRARALASGPFAAPEGPAWAATLASQLAAAGFEDVSVGLGAARLVVDAENSGYQWNNLDALGVALGLVSRSAAPAPGVVDLRLRQRGIVVLRAVGGAACIADWLRGADRCDDGGTLRLLAGARAQADVAEAAWWVHRQRAAFGRPRLLLSPDIDSRVGTEYGTLDASVGLNLQLQLPLWRGASADVAYVHALGHSADYDAGGPFADFRIDSQLYRVMLHQAVDIAPGLAARVAAGRLFKRLDGGLVELRWQPGDGAHRVAVEAARFNHRQVDFVKQSAMGSYRWFMAPLQTAVEVQGGRFWHGDRGAMGVLRHWFGDVSVALYLRRSRFEPDAPALYSPYGSRFVNAAGVEFSFPLTPRREHVGQWLQLRGAERFSYGVASVVGQKNTNFLTPWFGRFAPVPLGLAGSVDNSDRGSQAYLESNLGRVREAWRSLAPPGP